MGYNGALYEEIRGNYSQVVMLKVRKILNIFRTDFPSMHRNVGVSTIMAQAVGIGKGDKVMWLIDWGELVMKKVR